MRQNHRDAKKKKEVANLIDTWLRRAQLHQRDVALGVGLTDNQFTQGYKELGRKLKTDPDTAIAIVRIFAQRPVVPQRATREEAQQFSTLIGLSRADEQKIEQLFNELEVLPQQAREVKYEREHGGQEAAGTQEAAATDRGAHNRADTQVELNVPPAATDAHYRLFGIPFWSVKSPAGRRSSIFAVALVSVALFALAFLWRYGGFPPHVPEAAYLATQFSATPGTSCYRGAVTIHGPLPADKESRTENFMKSTRCKDINVRFTALPETTEVRAVPCSNQAAWMGDWHTFSTTGAPEDTIGWQILVARVPVDTCFYVQMRSISGNTYQVVGEVAY